MCVRNLQAQSTHSNSIKIVLNRPKLNWQRIFHCEINIFPLSTAFGNQSSGPNRITYIYIYKKKAHKIFLMNSIWGAFMHHPQKSQLLTAMCPHVKRSLVVGHPLFCKRLVEEQTAADKTAQALKDCQGRIPKTDLGFGSVWALKRWCSPIPHKAEKDLANYFANYQLLSNHRMKMLNIVKQIKTFQHFFFFNIYTFFYSIPLRVRSNKGSLQ